jgi:hypothetical protein
MGGGDNPALARFRLVCSSPPPAPAARAADDDDDDELSWTQEEKEKRKRKRNNVDKKRPFSGGGGRADVLDYWTSVLQQDPDALVEDPEDPGFVRCDPCGSLRMNAKRVTLTQHVVTRRHVDRTNTTITFSRPTPAPPVPIARTREEDEDDERIQELQRETVNNGAPAEEEEDEKEKARRCLEQWRTNTRLELQKMMQEPETFRQRVARMIREEEARSKLKKTTTTE